MKCSEMSSSKTSLRKIGSVDFVCVSDEKKIGVKSMLVTYFTQLGKSFGV